MQRAPIDRWLYEPDALIAAMRGGSRDFEADLDAADLGYALLRPDHVAAAVLDRDGSVVAANSAFGAILGDGGVDAALVREIAAGADSVIGFEPAASGSARRASAYAGLDEGRAWTLPPEIRPALERREAAVVMLSVAAATAGDAIAGAARSFGLTPMQSRVAVALVRTGNVRAAAAEAGIAYETAREAVAEAMKRAGATRLTGLVDCLVRLAFGVWPLGRTGNAILKDVWGMTPRQAELALQIAQGLTRAQAAKATGISEALAKKELEIVFATLEVATAAELARAVTEARALALLTSATGNHLPVEGDFLEPLRLVRRQDGTQIAFSDYGPASGKPVLVVHSSSASRQAPSRLVRTLQSRGFRPLAIDRPGFGLSDAPVARETWRADPFGDSACADAATVCRHLKLKQVDVIGRGGAQFVLAFAERCPELMGRVVLVNPDPPTTASRQRRGPVGAVKEAFYRFPDLIEKLAGMIASSLTPGRTRSIVNGAIRSSPPDLKVMEDPRNFADYARGFRLFTTGRVAGYVAEQIALRTWTPGPAAAAGRWHVLQGGYDPLHEPAEVIAYWRRVLPQSTVEMVPDAGRFLVMSHPELVAARLAGAA